jgi:hypothetical protein
MCTPSVLDKKDYLIYNLQWQSDSEGSANKLKTCCIVSATFSISTDLYT